MNESVFNALHFVTVTSLTSDPRVYAQLVLNVLGVGFIQV